MPFLFFVGCGKCERKDTALKPIEKSMLDIAVISRGSAHKFWKTIQSGARKAVIELGIEIIWNGPFKTDNLEARFLLIDNFINARVNEAVLALLDDAALGLPVERTVK